MNFAEVFELAPLISPEAIKSGELRCQCDECRSSNKNSPMVMRAACCNVPAAATIWHDKLALYCPECGKAVCQFQLATE